SENYKDDFKSIREFLSEKEEFILLKYLNDNFCYKFDKENYKLAEDFSNEELSGYFKRYIKFKNANDKVYISFFVQLLKGIEKNSKKTIKKELGKIDVYKKQINKLQPKLAEEFRELIQERYKTKLFKSILNNKVQVAGFFQDFEKNKVFISFEETLFNQLSILPEDFDDYSLNFKLDTSVSHLSLQYLNYSYFAITPEISE